MPNRLAALALAAAVVVPAPISARQQITPLGRSMVQYRSRDVSAVASYDYSQRTHDGAWLLIEFAVQARHRIAIHRSELTLVGVDERRYPLATQMQFLEDHGTLTRLLQNAAVSRRPLSSYFDTRPAARTIVFFASPGGAVTDSAVSNLDEVATGDLLFKSADGKWRQAAIACC